MAYLDPEFWGPVLAAALLCGLWRGALLRQSLEIGKTSRLRRFLASYESVPVVSALIALACFVVMITIDNLATQRGDDLEGASYLLAAAIVTGIPFFLGLIFGIPLAALSCLLVVQTSRLVNPARSN